MRTCLRAASLVAYALPHPGCRHKKVASPCERLGIIHGVLIMLRHGRGVAGMRV